MAMMSELSSLKDKISSQIGVIKLLEEKEARVKEIEVSLRIYSDKTHQIAEAETVLAGLKNDYDKLQAQKLEIQKEISKSDFSRADLHSSISRMELTVKGLDQEILAKRDDLLSIDRTTLDVKMRVEDIRNEEFDLLKSIKVQQNVHSNLMTEIARLEGAKTAALKMQDESLHFLKEKKEFYEREMALLEEGHKNKVARLDAEMVSKKIEWEQEFRVFSESKEKELEKRLAELEEMDLQELRKKQKDIASDIIDVFKKIQSKEGFSTIEQKMDEAKKDLNSVFEKHMGSLQRWKFW
jgi:chromosome segregation ATPase